MVEKVATKPEINITETLREMRVGDTLRFPVGINYGSVRTLATELGIRIRMRHQVGGELEVTRRR
jgi:hypothetical protein